MQQLNGRQMHRRATSQRAGRGRVTVTPRAALTLDPVTILKNIFKLSPPVRDAAFSKSVMAEEAKYILQTYARAPVVISHGKGAKMYDVEGKEYIDMAAGIAVNALGHSDGRWFASLMEQAEKLSHTSNLYHTIPQASRVLGFQCQLAAVHECASSSTSARIR